MSDLYPAGQSCLMLINQEIKEYFIEIIEKECKIYPSVSFNESDFPNAKKGNIGCIYLDNNEEFFINFYTHQVLIYILNNEFMFIDDDIKKNVVSSDTYGNVVYEGTLRNKTHKEILDLLCNFVIALLGAKELIVEENKIHQEGFQYPICNYNIKIVSSSDIKKIIKFDNICLYINN